MKILTATNFISSSEIGFYPLYFTDNIFTVTCKYIYKISKLSLN